MNIHLMPKIKKGDLVKYIETEPRQHWRGIAISEVKTPIFSEPWSIETVLIRWHLAGAIGPIRFTEDTKYLKVLNKKTNLTESK